MVPVVNEIQAQGVEVEHIPSGCTYLCNLLILAPTSHTRAFANEMGMLDDGKGSNEWNNKSTYEKQHFTVGVICEK